jgi:hypothetical protein
MSGKKSHVRIGIVGTTCPSTNSKDEVGAFSFGLEYVPLNFDTIAAETAALQSYFHVRPPEERDVSDDLLLADPALRRKADILSRHPLFRAPAGSRGLPTSAAAPMPPSGLQVTGSSKDEPKVLFVKHTLMPAPLHNDVKLDAIRTIDLALPERSSDMRPLRFAASGGEFSVSDGNIFEELVLVLLRGSINVRSGSTFEHMHASDRNIAVLALRSVDQKRLPELFIGAKDGRADGIIIGYSPLRRPQPFEWHIENERKVVATRGPACEISSQIWSQVINIPMGPAALGWAKGLPPVATKQYVHADSVQAGRFSVTNPWPKPNGLSQVHVLALTALGAAHGTDEHFAWHIGDEELLIALHGAAVCYVADEHHRKTERYSAMLSEMGEEGKLFTPHMIVISADSQDAKQYGPPAILLASDQPHDIAAANYGDAVCLHIRHSRKDKIGAETQVAQVSNTVRHGMTEKAG